MTRKPILISLVLAVAATACGSVGGGDLSDSTADTTVTTTQFNSPVATTHTTISAASDESSASTTTAGSSRETASTAPASQTTEPTIDESPEEGAIVTREAPDSVIQAVLDAAETRTGVDRHTMTLLRAQAVTFSDGSLDCPEPGMVYTQALINGYWIQLDVEGVILDYRVSDRGGMKLCESGGSDPLPSQDS